MDEDQKQRHNARMQHKKKVVNAAIGCASDTRGIVTTGNGKGKSTSAFGTRYRAPDHGQQAGVVQFIKGTRATGEVIFHQQNSAVPAVRYHAMATGFIWDPQNLDADNRATDEAWAQAMQMLRNPVIDPVLPDELTCMRKSRDLDTTEVLATIDAQARQTVIIAKRKHAFRAGVKTQPGIDA